MCKDRILTSTVVHLPVVQSRALWMDWYLTFYFMKLEHDLPQGLNTWKGWSMLSWKMGSLGLITSSLDIWPTLTNHDPQTPFPHGHWLQNPESIKHFWSFILIFQDHQSSVSSMWLCLVVMWLWFIHPNNSYLFFSLLSQFHESPPTSVTLTFSHLADALIHSDLQ